MLWTDTSIKDDRESMMGGERQGEERTSPVCLEADEGNSVCFHLGKRKLEIHGRKQSK